MRLQLHLVDAIRIYLGKNVPQVYISPTPTNFLDLQAYIYVLIIHIILNITDLSLHPLCWYNRTGWLGVKHQVTYLLISISLCPFGFNSSGLWKILLYLHEAFSFSPQVFAPHMGVRVCMQYLLLAPLVHCPQMVWGCACVYIYISYTGIVQNQLIYGYTNVVHTIHTHTRTHAHPHTFSYHLRTDGAKSGHCRECEYVQLYWQNAFQIQQWTILINLLHLQFWHNDRGPLCATTVTRGSNAYRNKSQHAELALENNRKFCRGSNPWLTAHQFGSLPVPLMLRCKSSRKLA